MRRLLLLLPFVFSLCACRKDDPPAPGGETGTWERSFGGPQDDWAFDVAADEAGNIYVLGRYLSEARNMYFLKLAPAGNIIWEKSVDTGNPAEGYALYRQTDGTLIATGRSYRPDGASDLIITALDQDGNLLWSQTHDQRFRDLGSALCAGPDGRVAVAGYTQEVSDPRDLLVLLLEPDGAIRWTRVLATGSFDGECAIAPAPDGGFLIAGATLNEGNGVDTRLYRLDAEGNTLWSRDWRKAGFQAPEALHPIAGADEFFLLTRDEAETASRTYLVDAEGRPGQLRHTLSGFGRGAAPTADGGFIISGFLQSPPPAFGVDLLLARFDAQGRLLWEKTHFGQDNRIGENAVETPDGHLVAVGYESTQDNLRDMYVLKVDRDGEW